jgi:hypothetical protein
MRSKCFHCQTTIHTQDSVQEVKFPMQFKIDTIQEFSI